MSGRSDQSALAGTRNRAERQRMRRTTGAYRMYRPPARRAAMKPSAILGVEAAGGRQDARTTRNSRYIAALTANTAPTPARAITTPAIAGPAALARLMLMEDSADADCS